MPPVFGDGARNVTCKSSALSSPELSTRRTGGPRRRSAIAALWSTRSGPSRWSQNRLSTTNNRIATAPGELAAEPRPVQDGDRLREEFLGGLRVGEVVLPPHAAA